MSAENARHHLLCYDIADRKRLQRVHRRVRCSGLALQYSLFDCYLTPAQLCRLVADLRELIDPQADDVRIYRSRPGAKAIWMGHLPIPDDILLFNNPREAASLLDSLQGPSLAKP